MSFASRFGFTGIATLATFELLAGFHVAVAQSPAAGGNSLDFGSAVKQMSKADKSASAAIDGRVRQVTWALLVGELAADPKRRQLFTLANDAFENGFDGLQKIEAELADPEKDKAFTRNHPLLAMRLDAAKADRVNLESKRALSRQQERARIEQLRELVRAYRELCGKLAIANTHAALTDLKSAGDANQLALKFLQQLDGVARRRTDFYLFDDEPKPDAGDAKEFALLTAAADPFSADVLRHVQAMEALRLYSIAGLAAVDRKAPMLEQALAVALAAGADKPETGSILAVYVAAGIHRDLGLLKTRVDPTSLAGHEAAKSSFANAVNLYKLLERRIGGLSGFAGPVIADMRQALAELTSEMPFQKSAATQLAAGEVVEAVATATRGLAHHRSPDLAALYVGVASRLDSAGIERAKPTIDRLSQGGLLPKGDISSALDLGRFHVLRVWKRLAAVRPADIENAERARLVESLTAARRELDIAIGGKSREIAETASAFRSLAAVAGVLLSSDAQASELRAALDSAGKAGADLSQRLKEANGHEQLDSREALIAARLAQGYLSVRLLPKYRDESTNAFAAAADELTRMPKGISVPAVGSHVLTMALARVDGQSSKLLVEERALRNTLARFVSGAIATSLGETKTGAQQLKSALRQLPGADGQAAIVDAGTILDQSGSGDVKQEVADTVCSVAALALCASGKYDEAVVTILAGLLGDTVSSESKLLLATTLQSLDAAIRRIRTPLQGCALGEALEGYAAASQHPEAARRALFGAALAAQTRVGAMLVASRSLAERNPEVAALQKTALMRLTKPEYYIVKSKALGDSMRLAEAEAVARQGLARHPDAPELTNQLINVLVERSNLDLPAARAKALEEALALIAQAQSGRKVGNIQLSLTAGELQEELGRPGQAIGSYEAVAGADEASPPERLKAKSRLAVLTARGGQFTAEAAR